MNEAQILSSQIAAEHTHAAQVVAACAQAFGTDGARPLAEASREALRDACLGYLVWTLARFEERDQTLGDRLRAGPAGAASEALAAALAAPGTSREALSRLETALAAEAGHGQAWRQFAQFFESSWRPRRAALDALIARLPTVSELRAVYGIDADSILEERARFARIAAALPASSLLPAPPPLTS